MINLPKPSQLRIKGTTDDKISYLLNYLTTLVTAIERILSSAKSASRDDKVVVEDISVANSKLTMLFTDGSEKTIDL